MPCPRLGEVEGYVDRRTAGTARAAMRAHLAACPECAREAEALSSLAAALTALPRRDPGREFTAAVMAAERAVPAGARRRPAPFSLSRWEMLGLAALYCAGVLFLVLRTGWPPLAGVLEGITLLPNMLAGLVPTLQDGVAAGARSLRPEWPAALTSPAAWGVAGASALFLLFVAGRGAPEVRRCEV